MMMVADNKFEVELKDQSKNPPGKDPVMAAFYQALSGLLKSSKDFGLMIKRVKKRRVNLTDKHFINLLFRAYQYIKFLENDLSHVEFKKEVAWQNEFNRILKDPKLKRLYEKLLMEKSTNTTIYQRYAGSYIILSSLFKSRDISVMDVGCGGNYGLAGIHLKEPFKKIEDHTRNKTIQTLLSKPVNLKEAVAIDIDQPDNTEVSRWRLACSFYPSELGELNDVLAFEKRVRGQNKVQFLQTDFLKLNGQLKKKFDAIIFCVMLYQHEIKDQINILEDAKGYLNPGGIIIVQDFAYKNKSNFLNFDISWFGEQNSHRTFIASEKTNWQFKEVLRWSNGRCAEVYEGEDFSYLINTT